MSSGFWLEKKNRWEISLDTATAFPNHLSPRLLMEPQLYLGCHLYFR
jgi:hypothetical protein